VNETPDGFFAQPKNTQWADMTHGASAACVEIAPMFQSLQSYQHHLLPTEIYDQWQDGDFYEFRKLSTKHYTYSSPCTDP
jgi:hypothetical protein